MREPAAQLEERGGHLQFLHLGLVLRGAGQHLVHQAHQETGGLGRFLMGDVNPPSWQTRTW